MLILSYIKKFWNIFPNVSTVPYTFFLLKVLTIFSLQTNVAFFCMETIIDHGLIKNGVLRFPKMYNICSSTIKKLLNFEREQDRALKMAMAKMVAH